MPFQELNLTGQSGVWADDTELGAWVSGTSTAAGPLVVYESANSGGQIQNSASTFTVALADTVAHHAGRFLVAPSGKLASGGDTVFRSGMVWTGLDTSAATAFDPVYLADTAVPPALTAGTIPRIVGYVLKAGAAFTPATGDSCGSVRLCTPAELRQVWVQKLFITAASTAIAGGSGAQAYDKTLSIPTRRFFNGTTAKIRAVINVGGVNSTDTFAAVLKLGSTAVVTQLATSPSVANSKIILEAEITARAAIGATAAVAGSGRASMDAMVTTTGMATNATAATNAAITVSVTIAYSTTNSGNTSTLQELSIEFVDPIGT